jgi:hypothetical protein
MASGTGKLGLNYIFVDLESALSQDLFEMKKTLLVLLSLVFVGCASIEKPAAPKHYTSLACQTSFEETAKFNSDTQLDMVSEFFNRSCFYEVIALGNFIRKHRRDKVYSLTTEAMEVFAPEGSFTPYVMESHERGYLTLLISMSYLHLGKEDSALVELRRGSEEQKAELYNYGQDPILNLLMGALWDRFDTSTSRPYWKFLSEFSPTDTSLSKFAQNRLKQIDTLPGEKVLWNIDGFGYLPELDWQADFIQQKKGPYRIETTSSYPPACSDEKSLLVPTQYWTDKIAVRYNSQYHPFLYAKSLVRLPVGIGYGLLGVTGGVTVGVGGCGLATQLGESGGELCKASLQAAGSIIQESGNLVSYTLKPDLRHWKKMPSAIFISKSQDFDLGSSCLVSHSSMFRTVKLTPN